MHFDRIHRRRLPQPEMRPRIVAREITPAAQNILALLHSVRGHIHRRAHRITRAFRPSNKLQLQPVILVRRNIPQQHRMPVHHVDHRVQLAVVEQVAHRHAAPRNHIRQPRTLHRGHILKPLAIDVMKQHRPLRPARPPVIFVRLRVYVPVRHQQVFPAVVVVVQKRVAPAQEGNCDLAQPHVIADVGKIRVALVVVERLVIV